MTAPPRHCCFFNAFFLWFFRGLKNEKKGFLSKEIKWDFTKFLVDKNGKVVKRFAPTVTPEKIIPYIEKLL